MIGTVHLSFDLDQSNTLLGSGVLLLAHRHLEKIQMRATQTMKRLFTKENLLGNIHLVEDSLPVAQHWHYK